MAEWQGMAGMAVKFEEIASSEITSLSGDTGEKDISKGLEAVPVQLHSSIKEVKFFQVLLI